MKGPRIELLIAAALPLAGCMPMEQVSLVYSSKADIGVGIATGTTATPGLDVHIGYHSLDAAFVPVAFAKHCWDSAKCSAANYDAQGISGSNEVDGRSVADQHAIDALRDEIATKQIEIKGNEKRIADLQAQIGLIDTLPAKQARQSALGAIDPGTGAPKQLTGDEQTEKAALDKEIPGLVAEAANKATLQAEVNKLTSANTVLDTAVGKASSKLELVTATIDKQTSDTKIDAYSVYGTFNGNGNGGSSGGALTAGKVFSTGIAAQNLTQGVSAATGTDAMARCMNAAASLLASPALQGDAHAPERERIAATCTLTARAN